MNGTISKRKTRSGRNSWAYIFDAGKKPDGSRRQVTKSGFETKRAAEDALRNAIGAYSGSGAVAAPRTGRSFREFFTIWMKDYVAGRCERTTIERYGELGEYVMGKFGHLDLDKIGAKLIEDTLTNLQKCGGRITKDYPGGRPLAPKTVSCIATLLRTSLKTAIRWSMLEQNPMDRVSMPKLVKREATALDEAQMDTLLAAAEGTRLHPFLVLAFATGARRGELLALQWSDLNAETGRLSITKQLEQTRTYGIRVKHHTKSKKPRSLVVPGWALDVILEHRDRQRSEAQLFGTDYAKHGLIFCQPDGSYYSPDKVGARVSRLAIRTGFASVHLHSLRHSHASQLLSQGVPLPAVSKRLGHADTSITAKVYAHVLPDDDEAAAEIWNSARRKVVDKTAEKARMLANVSFGGPAMLLKLAK